jgi:outer membrane protein OmpA-like peptidoglycan-associated protein
MNFLSGIFPLFFTVSLFGQTSSLPLWFSENFSDNSNRWNNLQFGKEYNKSNVFYLHKDKPFKILAVADSKALDSTTNYSSGISWGGKDIKNYYYFEISSKKTFRIHYVSEGMPHILKETTNSALIKSDLNQLEIERKGEDYIFRINKTEVAKMPFQPFFGTELELKSIDAKIKWLKFEIYQDMGVINMPETVKNYKATKENLGDKINSVAIEKFPCISPDGKKLYFIRENFKGDFGGQDIWFSEKMADGSWGQGQNAGAGLNDKENNYVNSIMPDNNTLCIGSLFTTHQTDTGWSKPKPIVIKGLKSTGSWVSYFLSADSKTLVYTLKQPETFGGRDIYVSFLEADGNFSAPLNLGSIINTSGNEHSPFLAADNKTLYFDSDGHPGFGGRDIFMTRRLDDSWKNWSKPENLGSAFNTAQSDEGMMIPASGEYAYFVSNQNGKNGMDIFRLKLPDALKPLPTLLVKGKLLEANSQSGIPAFLTVYSGDKEVATARTNPKTGDFQIILSDNSNYKVVIETKKAIYPKKDSFYLEINNLSSYQEKALNPLYINKIADGIESGLSKEPFKFDFLNTRNTESQVVNSGKNTTKMPVQQTVTSNTKENKKIYEDKSSSSTKSNDAKITKSETKIKTVDKKTTDIPLIQPKTILNKDDNNKNFSSSPDVLHTAYFEYGVHTLSAEESAALDKVIEKINLRTDAKIELLGHTDCIGNEEDNLMLSSLRIKSVEKYLIQKGLKAEKINSEIARGEKEPVADNNRSKGRAKNRRVELIMR